MKSFGIPRIREGEDGKYRKEDRDPIYLGIRGSFPLLETIVFSSMPKLIRSFSSLTFLLLLIGPLLSSASPDDHQVLRGSEAEERVEGAELVRISYGRKVPSFVRFRKGMEIPAAHFERWIKKRFKGLSSYELKQVEQKRDRLGMTHIHYRQMKNGVPIMGAECMVHIEGGKVRSFNGILFSSLDGIPTSPSIGRSTARGSALDAIDAELYKWEHQGSEQWLKAFTGNPDTSYFPEGQLVIAPSSGNVQKDDRRLAYRFNIYAHDPISRARYYVDASSGELLFKDDIIKHVDDTGTAVTGYSGSRQIVADSTGPSSYRLREAGRGNGIETYDMNEGTDYNNAVDFTDSDNYWNNSNADQDEYAGDAHWGAEMTYDYYWQKHNRNSIDDNGFALLSYVHYDQNYGNAFWDGQRMTYGDGDSAGTPLTALDICGHEVTHGLTSQTADLVYQDESGALNESFSDIFGNSIEHFAKPSGWTWEVGEDIGGIRSMSDPQSYGDPDTYQGTEWYTGNADNGGVHTNSGVQNYWYYLMVEGGSGTNSVGDNYSVTAVGWDTAGAIAYRNLVYYLGTGSEYADARFYSIQAAIDLYGACSQAHESTTNAWYAVNVGDPFNPTVTADFQVSKDSACTAPLTVNFTPLTTNASDFVWFFGDGDSTTGTAPTHTYTDTGSYTVELRVSGGCGSDTLVATDKIVIDPSIPCVRSMPTSGSDSISACTGTLYDNGGPDNNYPNQEDSYYTIAPSGATEVTLDFQQFDIEAGSGNVCDYDYLEIFDGASTSAPSLGTYCNTTGSPGTISSSGGAITLHLHSDQYVNNAGFEVEWSCTQSGMAPIADFTVDDTLNCNTVQFYDQSYQGAPNQYYWKFGDGDSSSAENPSHTYSQTGTYSVELIVSNSNGADSVLRSNLLHVQVPEMGQTLGDTVCDGQQATLYAEEASNGKVYWFDASSGGTQLGTTDSLSTAALTNTTDFFAEPRLEAPIQNVGPLDNNFGSGSYFNYDQHLVFDADTAFTLVSVKVYANGAQNRTIELRDDNGNVLDDTTAYVLDGEHRVELDFQVPEGQDYQLGVGGQGAELYRNDSGPNYPYSIQDIVRIKQSSASDPYDYYYFFYDWEIRGPDCSGDRTKVKAIVKECQSLEDHGSDLSLDLSPNPSKGRFLLKGSYVEEQELDLTITDGYGRVIRRMQDVSQDRVRLDLSDKAAGIYFLRLRSKNGSRVERLLIQR